MQVPAGSCAGRCGQSPLPGAACQCHAWCRGSGTCCQDFTSSCETPSPSPSLPPAVPTQSLTKKPLSHSPSSGGVTDGELSGFFTSLAESDRNSLASSLSLQLGCRTRVGRQTDCSPRPLFAPLQSSQLQARPVYARQSAATLIGPDPARYCALIG